MNQCRFCIRIVQQPESAALYFEAEDSTEATGELGTISGQGAANHLSFSHASEIEVLALRIIGYTLRSQIALGQPEARLSQA
jgi:hypothetical protein